jgi:hypothetical protein
MAGRWFEATDLISAAKASGLLKLLPDVDGESVVARLNAEAAVAVSLAAARRLPRDDRKRKLGPIARAARDSLRLLGLPSDLSPPMAHSVRLPPTIAAALRPGIRGVLMPFSHQLISLAGGKRELVNKADRAEITAKARAEDGKQAASQAMHRAIAKAVFGLVLVVLATLRETAERALAIVEAEPRPRLGRNTLGVRLLLRALARAHELLFGSPPQPPDKAGGRGTPSVLWTQAVIKSAADRLAADPNAEPSARALFAEVARLSPATLSDELQAS